MEYRGSRHGVMKALQTSGGTEFESYLHLLAHRTPTGSYLTFLNLSFPVYEPGSQYMLMNLLTIHGHWVSPCRQPCCRHPHSFYVCCCSNFSLLKRWAICKTVLKLIPYLALGQREKKGGGNRYRSKGISEQKCCVQSLSIKLIFPAGSNVLAQLKEKIGDSLQVHDNASQRTP